MNEGELAPPEAIAALCRVALDKCGPAIRFNKEWTDWQDIRAIACGVERLLIASGAGSNTAIAFAPRNRPSSLAAFLPLLAQQRCIRMVYPFQSARALAATLAALDFAVVVMDIDDFTPPVIETLRQAGIAGIGLGKSHAQAIAGIEQSARASGAAAPCIEILTSGTTGAPKHFPIGYDVVLGYVRQSEEAGATRGEVPPTLLCFPLSNISGLYTLAASSLRGLPVVLLERFTVAGWRDYVTEYRPASGGAPPAAVAMILADEVPADDLASLRSFSTGAAPLDPDTQHRFEKAYGIPVLQTYGATEFGGPVTAMTPQLRDRFGADVAGSVGLPFGGAKLRIRSADTGDLAAPDEVGIVEVVSPRMGHGWIVTSDLGRLDRNGFLFLQGRADGAIMRGGFKIVPEVVEAVLMRHRAVAAVSVVGVPDERLLEVPGALVVLAKGVPTPSFSELERHVRDHLSAPQVPAIWRIADALPRTVSFKVDRVAVRELLAELQPSPGR